MTSILLGMGLILIAMVVLVIRRGLQMRRLVDHGVPATAIANKVIGHTGATGMRRSFLRYSFEDSAGKPYQNKVMISPAERDAIYEGASVAIIYLPDNPKISALAQSVESARNALEK
ncbi:hypothetical protein QWY82_08045 [Simiduia curdlanivorans]|uniref:DUF3592 domain-containing protein n=1 Tax=Simiduia curdlanivorans TaxID=1492769 RepID=A0ABV8V7J8_9GAMM|nr:DUF3592 domain-containing protein [Simiduia curdlanivorans]MDN3638755.1 hypothetical protein [Simiduia curdlanivorans]